MITFFSEGSLKYLFIYLFFAWYANISLRKHCILSFYKHYENVT